MNRHSDTGDIDIISEQGKRLMNHRQRSLDRGLQNSYIFQGESVSPSAFRGFRDGKRVEGFTNTTTPTQLLSDISNSLVEIRDKSGAYKTIPSMREERARHVTAEAQLFDHMRTGAIQQATLAIGALGMVILAYHVLR